MFIGHFMLPIRIHCWGGFGSQLFAYCLLKELSSMHTARHFKLIFHDSGITQRPIEIKRFLNDVDYCQVHDFTKGESKKVKTKGHLEIAKRFLLLMRVVMSDKEITRDKRVWPWTISIRGHYSNRPINPTIISALYSTLIEDSKEETAPSLLIHYRLGDLLHTESKSFVMPITLTNVINREISSNSSKDQSWIITENPVKAKSMMPNLLSPNQFEFISMDVEKLLSFGIRSRLFIGTNSKLSIWIVLMRVASTDKRSIVPESIKEALSKISGWNLSKVDSYEF